MISEAGKQSVRHMIFTAFQVDVPSRSFDYSDIRVQKSAPASPALPVPAHHLDWRAYVAVIRTLQPAAAAWVRWAYADRHPTAANHDLHTIAHDLWENYRCTLTAITDEQEARLMALVQPALEQVAALNRRGKKKYRRTDLYEITGAPESSWQRDMQPHWKALQDYLKNLDHRALTALDMKFAMVNHRHELGAAYDVASRAEMRVAV